MEKRMGKKVLPWLISLVSLFIVLFVFVPNLSLSEIENPELKVEKITHTTFIEERDFNYSTSDSIEIEPGEKTETYLSPVYHLENPTDSVAIRWQQSTLGPDAKVWLKIYENSWSDWVKVEKKDLTEIPDQEFNKLKKNFEQGDITSELIFCEEAAKFQYRIKLRANRFKPTFEEISFYAMGQEELPTWKEWLSALLSPSQVDGSIKVISRKQWGANEGWRKKKINGKWKVVWPTRYTKSNKIILHHDGNARNLVPKNVKQAKTWIQGIYYYHAKLVGGNGWGDIGYNYLVDPWGNIYQGRIGTDKIIKGKRHSVIAGHTYGQNTNSIGICLLGNYQLNRKPTLRSLKKLGEFAGHKAIKHKFATKRIYGHRDFANRPRGRNYTACPGKNFYRKRGYLRNLAAKYVGIHNGRVPNGLLISATGSSRIYLTSSSKKRPFLSRGVFYQRGYRLNKVVKLSPEIVKKIPIGKIIIFKNKTLIKSKTKKKIYRILKGKRRPFLSRKAFRQRGFRLNRVKRIENRLLQQIPLGSQIVYQRNTLLKAKGKHTIWVIKRNKRYYFSRMRLFLRLGYREQNVRIIGKNELKLIRFGGNIKKLLK